MLKSAITLTSAAALLALAACSPPHPHVRVLRAVSALDCPDSQGDLNRRAQASDGKSCDYADDEGDQVSLRLIALNGQDPGAALAPMEAQLKSELPTPPGGAAASTDGGKDRVDIDLPGIHIHAKGDNDAKVDLGGVRINAPEPGVHGARDSVTINSQGASTAGHSGGAGVSVNASDDGAEIRVNAPGGGVRRSFILAADNPGPTGFKAVGYEARGPAGGPLVVALFKAKSDDHDTIKDDLEPLLRRNTGR